MDEKLMEIAFGIITFAGEAKFTAKEALNIAKTGKFSEAKDKLNEAREVLNNAHKHQTELITKEAQGEQTPMSVVLVHSQDHLMTTIAYLEMVEELIALYEFILNNQKN